jgi:HTH-type transcriptional regulator / antitoxin HigA
MKWKVIKSESEYRKALRRTIEIFDSPENSPEDEELGVLLLIVKDYEDKHIKLPKVSPIEVIKLKMYELGITAKDLEKTIGSKGHVSSILSGRREITLKMASKLREYFQLPAEIFFQ